MSRTIRQHFKHRVRVILAAVGATWLLLPAAAVLSGPNPERASALGVCLFAAVSAVVIGSVIALLRVNCPKCGVSLAHLGSDLTFPMGSARIDACPHCSVSLDSPLP